MSFPDPFVWGAAAASYQIEGGAEADGKGLSIWDVMCRQPHKIAGGHTGDIACDHYHRYAEDIQLMADIGLQAYRLSLPWPRILPDGIGRVNEKGLEYCDRIIDTLLEHHIEPWVTLFHWDYPQALFEQGGWLNRNSADWFAEYTQVVVDRLSDRVTHWMPHNEPQCFIGLGHQTGDHAPGIKLSFSEILTAIHHSLLAHGKAVQVIRAQAKRPPQIGTALVGIVSIPATDHPDDIAAARSSTLAVSGKHCWNNTWFADPLILGHYPEDGMARFHQIMPNIQPRDLETICQPLDFYGLNIYQGQTVRAESDGCVTTIPHPPGGPRTTMDWPVTPEALYWGPRFIYERYQLPIVITENGMANCDWVHRDGKVHDPQRIDFLARYLQAYGRAIDDGIEAKGYFLWSVMDNFEWAFGYDKRFGIVYVDYETQQRTLKDSAYWYKDVIASKGQAL
ncbi:GH1 family beta-glucosidase [Acaryochloris sp. IP29b_bin.137]|uniref:GH1 family beta-glucosidase n=1 Tax=Acaryochloris sp. IP29b_bin.137 TaxID=2969217 RepID=UPI0026040AF8|nr:GH1 family beta-glucosidase [Acaryochloris sp. IP29b_bin.137]